jgi:3',5'-cyclic AMP phosphodiesterase CpdA
MKILHFGDIHVWSRRILFSEWYYTKRWLGPINLNLRRAKHFPPELRENAVREILNTEADQVIFTGDFTTFSLKEEFIEAARLFAPLREKWGDRLIAIPGNHDCYTARSVRMRYLETHLPWVETKPVSRHDLTPTLSLVTVNHAVPFHIRSNGLVTPELQSLVEEALTDCKKENRQILLAGHFPYATPDDYPETWEHRLLGEDDFARLLREHPPALYLHGHKHVRWAIRPPQTPDTLCLNCGSASMLHDNPLKHAGFLTFDLSETGNLSNLTNHTHQNGNTWRASPMSIP